MKIFPWAPFGINLLPTPLSQIAEFTGVYGLTFISVLLGALILDSFRNHKLAILIPLIYIPLFTLGIIKERKLGGKELKVIAIATDFSRHEKWLDFKNTMEKEFEITERAINKNKKREEEKILIVWPETSLPLPFELLQTRLYSFVREKIKELIVKEKIGLIIGAPEGKKGINGFIYSPQGFFNSAFFITKGDVKVQRKMKLVPFGEFTPLRGIIERIDLLKKAIKKKRLFRESIPYKGPRETFSIDKLNFSIFICWETLFPSLVRSGLKNGEFIVNISNDVWFGGRWGAEQHFKYAVLRSIENRAYLVRSSNKGFTGIVEPSGKFKYIIGEGYVVGYVGRRSLTFYSKHGDIFIYLLFLPLILTILKKIERFNQK
jgi:apolipoprotein N-acyltransferase